MKRLIGCQTQTTYQPVAQSKYFEIRYALLIRFVTTSVPGKLFEATITGHKPAISM